MVYANAFSLSVAVVGGILYAILWGLLGCVDSMLIGEARVMSFLYALSLIELDAVGFTV